MSQSDGDRLVLEPNLSLGRGLAQMPRELADMKDKLAIDPKITTHFHRDTLDKDEMVRYLDARERKCENCDVWHDYNEARCPYCGSTRSKVFEPSGEPKAIATEDGITTRKFVKVRVAYWNDSQQRRGVQKAPPCFGGDGKGHSYKERWEFVVDPLTGEAYDKSSCEVCGDYKGKKGFPIVQWEEREGYKPTPMRQAVSMGAYRIPVNDPASFDVFKNMGALEGTVFVHERVLAELRKR